MARQPVAKRQRDFRGPPPQAPVRTPLGNPKLRQRLQLPAAEPAIARRYVGLILFEQIDLHVQSAAVTAAARAGSRFSLKITVRYPTNCRQQLPAPSTTSASKNSPVRFGLTIA